MVPFLKKESKRPEKTHAITMDMPTSIHINIHMTEKPATSFPAQPCEQSRYRQRRNGSKPERQIDGKF